VSDSVTPRFRTALRDAVRVRDCLGLALVPAVALAVFGLSEQSRWSLAFAYEAPTMTTAYAAHFVHFEAEHLVANLLGYTLLAGGGYVLAALAGYRRLFRAAAATNVLAVPLTLSALNLAVPRNAVGYGLSGINMAFAGLFGLVLVGYADRCLKLPVRVRDAPGVFFAAAAIISLVAVPTPSLGMALGAANGTIAAGYAVAAGRGRRLSVSTTEAGWLDAGVLATVTFLGYPFVGFPAPVATDGVVVNHYVHFLGFGLGFVVPYAALATGAFDHGSDDPGLLSD